MGVHPSWAYDPTVTPLCIQGEMAAPQQACPSCQGPDLPVSPLPCPSDRKHCVSLGHTRGSHTPSLRPSDQVSIGTPVSHLPIPVPTSGTRLREPSLSKPSDASTEAFSWDRFQGWGFPEHRPSIPRCKGGST